ncbi:MAG: hypothetical protein ACRCUE_17560, partial [Bosea sp. (in: a-proteobacteria)]
TPVSTPHLPRRRSASSADAVKNDEAGEKMWQSDELPTESTCSTTVVQAFAMVSASVRMSRGLVILMSWQAEYVARSGPTSVCLEDRPNE